MSRFLKITIAGFLLCASQFGYAESVNHAPPFQVYEKDPVLEGMFPQKGANASNLCWPSALAHRMFYYQNYASPPLRNLALGTNSGQLDVKSAVQTFVGLCHTDIETGTPQGGKLACIDDFLKTHGYQVEAFSIGKWARPRSRKTGTRDEFRPVQISDLRSYLSQNYAVILHIGWLKYNKRKRAWLQYKSHSLNAYGYDYEPSWGESRIVLKLANPAMNYSNRAPSDYFDSVVVSELRRKPGVGYPPMVDFVLRGPGFDNPKHMAVLDDIYVFKPRS